MKINILTKDKITKYSFENTLLSLNLWFLSVSYHLLAIYVGYFVSFPKNNINTNQYSNSYDSAQKIVGGFVQSTKEVIIPTKGKPLSPYILAVFIQVIIFNTIFFLLFYLLNRINKKNYNIFAIYLVGFITSFVFIIITKLFK